MKKNKKDIKEEKSVETNEDVLNIVYDKNPKFEYEVDEDNIVTILIEQNHPIQKVFRKLKANIPEYRRLQFDEKTSFVFLQLDGIKNVKVIGELLKDKYGDDVEPLYERLLLLLNHLCVNEGYIERKEESSKS